MCTHGSPSMCLIVVLKYSWIAVLKDFCLSCHAVVLCLIGVAFAREVRVAGSSLAWTSVEHWSRNNEEYTIITSIVAGGTHFLKVQKYIGPFISIKDF